MKRVRIQLALLSLLAGIACATPFDGTVYYVGGPNASDDHDGTAPEAPLATIVAAVTNTVAGDIIRIADGTYAITETLVIDKAIRVEGNNDNPEGVIITRLYQDTSHKLRLMNISGGAFVTGITLEKGDLDGYRGFAGAYLTDGILSNSIVRLCGNGNGNNGGGGIYMNNAAALVVDCNVYSNANTQGNSEAGGVLMNGGTLLRSRVWGNTARGQGAGVGLYGTINSYIIECDIYDNIAGKHDITGTIAGWGPIGGAGVHGNGIGKTTIVRSRICGNRYYRAQLNNADLYRGAGAYQATLYDSLVVSNVCPSTAAFLPMQRGGGLYNCEAYNCTIMHNESQAGGGVYGGSYYNCIIMHNRARGDSSSNNWDAAPTIVNSCTIPAATGSGNIAAEPFVNTDYTLQLSSPCIEGGDNSYTNSTIYVNGCDLGGQPRLYHEKVDMGCYEVQARPPFKVILTGTEESGEHPNFSKALFAATIIPPDAAATYAWDFGDGTLLPVGTASPEHQYEEAGDFTATVAVTSGGVTLQAATTVTIKANNYDYYVALPIDGGDDANSGATPSEPLASLEFALSLCGANCRIFMADGLYSYTQPLTLSSAVDIYGNAANRQAVVFDFGSASTGVTLNNQGASLNHITVANAVYNSGSGIGVSLMAGTVSNCVIRGCYGSSNAQATAGGGIALLSDNTLLIDSEIYDNANEGSGAYLGGGVQALGGRIIRCHIHDNYARGAGGGVGVPSGSPIFEECLIERNYNAGRRNKTSGGWTGNGAGAAVAPTANAEFRRCRFVGNIMTHNPSSNTKEFFGAGVYGGKCSDCLIVSNRINYLEARQDYIYGGGSYNTTLINCTVADNEAYNIGGVYGGTATNCIIWDNRATNPDSQPNYNATALIGYTCTTPLASGSGNIDTAPLYRNRDGRSDYFPRSSSKTVNAGNKQLTTSTTDLLGAPRIVGQIDLGCYENQAQPNTVLLLR